MTDKRKGMLPEEETYKTLEEAHVKTEKITSNSSQCVAGLVLLVIFRKATLRPMFCGVSVSLWGSLSLHSLSIEPEKHTHVILYKKQRPDG